MSGGRGLVFGGGGVAGIAWEIGVVAGLSDAPGGVPPARLAGTADVLIGTSAGAVVAAQLATGCDVDELYDAQLAGSVREIEPVAGQIVDGAERRGIIAARLPRHEWPAHNSLRITAVDVGTGGLTVFDRDTGVQLVDAVAASCAVPGVWPPVMINGRHYVDGGMRSSTNADLATGCVRLLVVAPLTGDASLREAVNNELQLLPDCAALVLSAEPASYWDNSLSPHGREPAALAGRALGRAWASEVARHWA